MSRSCKSSQEQKEPRGQQPPVYTKKRSHLGEQAIQKAPNIKHGQIEIEEMNKHTMRNFFRSRPWPISFKVKKPLLISYLSERAMLTIVSSGIVTSGMFGGDLNTTKCQSGKNSS
jgi:hypothetical protein